MKFLFFSVGARDLRVVSYWIDTLVLKNRGKYLRYCVASPFPLRGNTTQAREVAPIRVDHLSGISRATYMSTMIFRQVCDGLTFTRTR